MEGGQEQTSHGGLRGDKMYHTFAGGDKRGEGGEEAGEGSTEGIFAAITL